jgi:hypothetical protein
MQHGLDQSTKTAFPCRAIDLVSLARRDPSQELWVYWTPELGQEIPRSRQPPYLVRRLFRCRATRSPDRFAGDGGVAKGR